MTIKGFLRKSIGGMLIMTLLASISGCSENTTRLNKEKEDVAVYLNKKYGKQFVVTDARYHVPYLGAQQSIITTAYPKDDPELVFEVQGTIDGDYKMDFFLEKYWSKKLKNSMEEYFDSLFDNHNEFDIALKVISSEDYEEILKKSWGYIPGLDEGLEKYKDKLSITIENALFTLDQSTSLQTESEKVFNVLQWIKTKNFGGCLIRFYYYPKNYEKDAEVIIKGKSFEEFISNSFKDESDTKKPQYYIFLRDNTISQITRPEDLMNLFETN